MKNALKIGALTFGVLASTVGYSQTNKTVKLPEPDKAKVITVDTTYVRDKGSTLEKTIEFKAKATQVFVKDSTSVKKMEENGLTEAYTLGLKKENQDLAKEVEFQTARADSANNYFQKGKALVRAGMNVQDFGDNTYKINPIFGAGYSFHIKQFGDDVKLSLDLLGSLGTPKNIVVEEGAKTLIRETANPAGPSTYISDFFETEKVTTTTQQVADLALDVDFKVGDYGFAVAAGPSVSYKSLTTTTSSSKENYIVANATGNSIPSSKLDLGDESSTKTRPAVEGFNAAITYKGKSKSRFNFGIYGSNIGSNAAHYGATLSIPLYKSVKKSDNN